MCVRDVVQYTCDLWCACEVLAATSSIVPLHVRTCIAKRTYNIHASPMLKASMMWDVGSLMGTMAMCVMWYYMGSCVWQGFHVRVAAELDHIISLCYPTPQSSENVVRYSQV